MRETADRELRRTPYVAGALLGVTAAVSIALFAHPLGASGAVAQISGLVARRITPHSVYWGFVIRPGFGWPGWMLTGVLVGAFVSARLRGPVQLRAIPERGWIDAFGPSVALRWALGFLGAAIVQFGAGIAGGCASGLAISGGVVLAPAAFVFMAAMFAGGIPVALFVGHLRERRRGRTDTRDGHPQDEGRMIEQEGVP